MSPTSNPLRGFAAGLPAPMKNIGLSVTSTIERPFSIGDSRAHRMSKEAEAHSRAMARSKRLWHTAGPVRYGAHCYAWGENLGWTTGDVPDLEKAFMASAGHREHILDRTFRRAAVGAVKIKGKLWVTVFFCT